jgi:hypothetical protein
MAIMTDTEDLRLYVGYELLLSHNSTENLGQISMIHMSIELCRNRNLFESMKF